MLDDKVDSKQGARQVFLDIPRYDEAFLLQRFDELGFEAGNLQGGHHALWPPHERILNQYRENYFTVVNRKDFRLRSLSVHLPKPKRRFSLLPRNIHDEELSGSLRVGRSRQCHRVRYLWHTQTTHQSAQQTALACSQRQRKSYRRAVQRVQRLHFHVHFAADERTQRYHLSRVPSPLLDPGVQTDVYHSNPMWLLTWSSPS